MSSREGIIAGIEALRAHPQKHLMDLRAEELMRNVTEAAMSLPDDGSFLAGLLQSDYESLGSGGDLLVCLSLHGAIAERKVRDAIPVLNRMLVDSRTVAMHEDLAETLGEMGDESSVPYLI